ncbi:lachesin-like protein, partial [Dinothrombium tinctorium]
LAALPEEDFPEFSEPIPNVTVAVGRDVQLPCVVTKLGDFRAAWLRVEDKGILTIHQNVITRNYRVSLSASDNRNFILVIKNVQESDRGGYMCQINTVPMRSQVGYLDVVVPPDIVVEESSSDVVVTEGSNVTMRCKAKGYPTPSIKWKREDSGDILLHSKQDKKHNGDSLTIIRVTRVHMGAYLCIASNGVPPSVSRRIMLSVHFAPVLWAPVKSVGATIGREANLECHVEAFPEPSVGWVKENGESITGDNDKYVISVRQRSYKSHLRLTIRNVNAEDVGTYKCYAKNAVGNQEGYIKLFETPVLTDFSAKQQTSANRRRQNDEDKDGDESMEEEEMAIQDAQKSLRKQSESQKPGYSQKKSDRSVETHQPNHRQQLVANRILTFIGISIVIPVGLT